MEPERPLYLNKYVAIGFLVLVIGTSVIAILLAAFDPLGKGTPTLPKASAGVLSWHENIFFGRVKNADSQYDWRASFLSGTERRKMRKELTEAVVDYEIHDLNTTDHNYRFNMQCLAAHNFFRLKHKVPKLVLNSALVKLAEETVMREPDLIHDNSTKYGTNVEVLLDEEQVVSFICKKVVEKWYLKGVSYDPEDRRTLSVSLPFTQIVWKNTKNLGCAYKKLPEQILLVCHYEPRGNIIDLYNENDTFGRFAQNTQFSLKRKPLLAKAEVSLQTSVLFANLCFLSSKMSLSQEATLKSYQKHLKDDVRSILDNFVEILKLVKVDSSENTTNYLNSSRIQENYEMNVRAANIVRAAHSLNSLIYSIKQFIIINDFPLINEAISQKPNYDKVNEIDNKLMHLRDEISSELFELEEDYYSSIIK